MTTTSSREAMRTMSSPTSHTSDPSGWARSAAVAGIAFVVFDVVGTFLPGAPPASDASAAKIATYFKDHAGGIKGQLLLGGLGIAALMWWFGGLWRILSRAEGERPQLSVVAGISLVSGLTLALVSGAVNAAAAFNNGNAATTHMFFSLGLVTIAAAGFGIGTSLIATSAVTYRTRVTPRWITYLGFVAGLFFLASTLGAVSDSNALNQLGLGAFFTWCVWIIAVSTIMWRTTEA